MMFFVRLAERIRAYDRTHNFTCNLCGREVFGGEHICSACRARLFYIDRCCPVCGRRVSEEGICADCKQRRPVADMVRSRFLHEGACERLVLRFKCGERYLAATLAQETAPLLQEFDAVDALVPVPMTARAKRRRGYDQALLLAKEISAISAVPVLCAVTKQRETPEQKGLGRRERETNLAGCFHVTDRKEVKGKRLVIIDDIYTTGATVDELASVLKRAGAAKVYAVTVTSVEDKTPFGCSKTS